MLPQVLDESQVRALRMGLFLGVAQGAAEPLKLLHLTYTPHGPVKQVVGGSALHVACAVQQITRKKAAAQRGA